ncbi:MAG TPA: ABC transporter ATP-binding protein [Anaerolineaceae bacterium]|jgi:ABC-2 type transport system ATP-binding protein
MTVVLETNELCRFFGEYAALTPTSFEIAGGEIVALTGPNGAGKSTLLLCLSGLLRPSKGTIKVCGFDLYEDEVESRRRLAFVPDVPRFYTELTAWEHLKFIALAHEADQDFDHRAEELLKELDLWDGRDLYPHNFSRGMRLKLGLAMALIRPFDLLILDEPASALDPQAIDYLKSKLLNLRYKGAAILLTTHHLDLVTGLNASQWMMEKGVLHINQRELGA